ncbi:MAG: insulinase family protein, partial [Candidatus Rokuibacteriota bacterium]
MTLALTRRAFLATVGWGLAGCATAGQAPSAPAARGDAPAGPVREVLPNGVTLIAQEHRASAVVAVQMWVKVGGRDETADELGLSHYLEHMLFKGTPTRPPGSI